MTFITIINLIVAPVVLTINYVYALAKIIRNEKDTTRRSIQSLIMTGFYLASMLIILTVPQLDAKDILQLVLTLGLVTATISYAISAINMAEEMRNARYDAVRPVIDIYRDSADDDKMSEAVAATKGDASQGLSCALRNVGLGPAIDLYSFVQNSSGSQRYDCGTLAVKKETPRMKLSMINEINKDHPSDLLLVALYRDVYDRDFISSREVSVDKERKGAWSIGPLKIRKIAERSKPK